MRISEKQLDDWQRDIDLDPKSFTSWPLSLLSECIAEIRRQRELIAGLTPLAKLGCIALDASDGGGDFDGTDIYENAIRVGAVLKIPFDPEKHEDVHGVGMEAGDDWGEYPPQILAAKRSLEEG